ncbi:MAG: hypothetical protein ABIH34_06025, partial [Nanoarchaeota archaeon]
DDYKTVADAEGNFEFKAVNLISNFRGGLTFTEMENDELNTNDMDRGQALKLLFYAEDSQKRKTEPAIEHNLRVTPCGGGTYRWVVNSLPEFQFPIDLSVERLANGEEGIDFLLDFDYIGDPENQPIINGITIKSISSGEQNLQLSEKYKIGAELIDGVSAAKRAVGQSKTKWFVSFRPLKQNDQMEHWLDDDFKDFIDSLSNEITFPMKITVTFSEMGLDKEGNRIRIPSQKQEICYDGITYNLDSARLDARHTFLISYLLEGGLVNLKNLGKGLSKATDSLRTATEWTAKTCMFSFLGRTVTGIYRRIACSSIVSGPLSFGNDDPVCFYKPGDTIKGEPVDSGKIGKPKPMDELSNEDLKACYSSCSTAWKAEEKVYQAYRMSCDRIFGKVQPAKWTEGEEYTNQKLEDMRINIERDQCKISGSIIQETKGLSLSKMENCPETKDNANYGDCVRLIYDDGQGKKMDAVYEIEGITTGEKATGTVSLKKINTPGSGTAPARLDAITVDNSNEKFFAPIPLNCENYCQGVARPSYEHGVCTGYTEIPKEGSNNPLYQSNCNGGSENGEGDIFKDQKTTTYEKGKDIIAVKEAGFTLDCPSTDFKKLVLEVEEGKKEIGQSPGYGTCCCYEKVGERTEASKDPYYDVGDKESEEGWNLRYDRIEYMDKSYNPNRYYTDRDFMACFG